MDKLPWFPFYAAEFLTDTKVLVMTNEQVGIYVKLLVIQWREGSIPSDMEKLGRMVGLLGDRIPLVLPLVCECFTIASDETLQNRRMEEVRREQLEKISQKTAAGKAGANARWNKGLDATALPQQSGANSETMQEGDKEVDLDLKTNTKTLPPNGGSSLDADQPKDKPKNLGDVIYPKTFEKFWLSVPLPMRGPKPKALEQWKRKHIDDRGELFLDDLMEMHQKQVAHWTACERQGKFCARPQDLVRWIRDERWKDEIPDIQSGNANLTPGRHDDVSR